MYLRPALGSRWYFFLHRAKCSKNPQRRRDWAFQANWRKFQFDIILKWQIGFSRNLLSQYGSLNSIRVGSRIYVYTLWQVRKAATINITTPNYPRNGWPNQRPTWWKLSSSTWGETNWKLSGFASQEERQQIMIKGKFGKKKYTRGYILARQILDRWANEVWYRSPPGIL